MDKYETTVGLEVHVELNTSSKIFCACPTAFGAEANTQVCPVCMGLPGALPTFNGRVLEKAVAAGIVTECKIAGVTRFDRKNYFYPDLPKAYQISQHEYPVCFDGGVNIEVDGVRSRIGIERIHMEEDAGKLSHCADVGTLVDYNRCGVPLIEIVSKPQIHSAAEARAYLTELRTLLLYADVSDCRMDKGSMRCDLNVSVRREGDAELGVRVEVKNINSIAFVGKAIEYESARQTELLERGEKVVCETRRFEERDGSTRSMRMKESAADYRFFPEPDLGALTVTDELISRVREGIPRLPSQRREEYSKKWGISDTDARIITLNRTTADFFETAASVTAYPKIACNVLLTELIGSAKANDGEGVDFPISPYQLASLCDLFGNGDINSSTVKRLLKLLMSEGGEPSKLVEKYSLAQIRDEEYLTELLFAVVKDSPKLMNDYVRGKVAAKKAIVGGVMAKSGGRADPRLLNEIFEKFSQNYLFSE